MPFSLSVGSFMRKLSVQPEESGTDLDNDQGEETDPDKPVMGKGAVMPLSFHSPPIFALDQPVIDLSSDNDKDMESYLRKLSIASMSSVKSTNSLSSTCSAPGGISMGDMENMEICNNGVMCKKDELLHFKPMMSRRIMTSRPSFISLCSIVSETSEVPQKFLPAPLQVELDLMQRSGIEGDEPKCRSHLPILRCPSDYDINEMINWKGNGQQPLFRTNSRKRLVSGIKGFPSRIRKLSTEKNRFDIYSLSDEIREQLKQLYVY